MSKLSERGDVKAGLFAADHAVPLLGVEVHAEVVAGHCRSTIHQRYRNDEARAIEAVYVFPLPAGGAVSGFAMSVNGRRLEGEVHEREEAFRRYDDALIAGHGGALLEQERPNVFTANVGNLLPGEETIVEIEVIEPMKTDEGGVRWSLPTLVAPRYMAGAPDAERISPPTGNVRYGLSLELVFDLGCAVDVESPSHAVHVDHGHWGAAGGRTRVSFAQREVALDRDIVVTAFPRRSASETTPIASVVAHRAGQIGTFALTVVPDLAGMRVRNAARTEVVFLLDRSGSMGGSSIVEARAALRLCLRQLREGDRFAILAFDDQIEMMSPALTTFTSMSLAAADRWIEEIDARGGTELLEPLLRATALAPHGVVMLLTDGQVGNEDEIARAVLARCGSARIHSFGIGTNVSDALLLTLADRTGGAAEMIHPGERIDDKVVAQFARATARRVTDLRIAFRGVEIGEIAPAAPTVLIDGEPLTIFGTYEEGGIGAVEIRGLYEGERMYLEVPVDLPSREDRPAVAKLWAQARIRDLERTELTGRRADAMKSRIVQLAKDYGVSSKYTSFVVVEKRTGARRAGAPGETRVVPVSAPAGWAMGGGQSSRARSRSYGGPPPAAAPGMARRMSMAPARPAAGAPSAPRWVGAASSPDEAMARSAPPPPPACRAMPPMNAAAPWSTRASDERVAAPTVDPVLALLERQAASGLWEEPGREPIAATVDVLLSLVRLGLSTSHAVHGAQTKKAVDALLEVVIRTRALDQRLAELALATIWLLATGRRTRQAIEEEASQRGLADLAGRFGRGDDLRAYVEQLAPMC
jgi:Ca-activated chloride channel homolog